MGPPAVIMGIQYFDHSWLDPRHAGEVWPAAAVPVDRTEPRYYVAAAATLIVALALMAAPVLVASLAIDGILR